jgi:hypothetical protein
VTKKLRVAPRAAVLVESMRDIGYSLKTALADVIDNSLAAGARQVDILADTHSGSPAIAILDDGSGMTEAQLIEAMRPGTRSPLEGRDPRDLGRFGLGLKTASFSQGRRLTVVTRQSGTTSCARWDLDEVAASDDWLVELPEDTDGIPWIDRLGERGTLVIWQKLDRLVDQEPESGRASLVNQIDEAAAHVELVFHRFMSGEPGIRRIDFRLNGRALLPFDPFKSGNRATQFEETETFSLGGQEVTFQVVTLPHHKKVSAAEWERYAGADGYLRNQGFYLYRNRRLIIHGTWFGLARQTELTKLCRVRIEMPNGLDAAWKIDVKKASAQLPAPIRDRLRRIIERVGATSRRAYAARGARLVSDTKLPVWTRNQKGNRISYGLNAEHPVMTGFLQRLEPGLAREFESILELLTATLPVDALIADIGAGSEQLRQNSLDDSSFAEIVRRTYTDLRLSGFSHDDVVLMLSSASPFRENWAVTSEIAGELRGKVD